MHANYLFLMSVEEGDQPMDIVSNWEERMQPLMDENNWYEPLAVVYPDGKVFNAATPGDWRGRDEFAGGFFEDTKDPWKAAWDLAAGCVGDDLTDHTDLDAPNVKTVEELRDAIPYYERWVAKAYETTPDQHTIWKRGKISHVLNELLYRGVDNERFPFTAGPISPYDNIRAQDLDYNNDFENVCILVVDIHT